MKRIYVFVFLTFVSVACFAQSEKLFPVTMTKFKSDFTGADIAVKRAKNKIGGGEITDGDIDNRIYFKFPDGMYGVRYFGANISVLEIGAVGDGITDDTEALQSAINLSSSLGIELILESNRVYYTKSLVPKPNLVLNLNGSTLKLKNKTDAPLIFDNRGNTKLQSNLTIRNGIIDGNMAYNDLGNTSGGGIWLASWENVRIENIKFVHCFRNMINFYWMKDVQITNITGINCGKKNNGNFFSYGADFNFCENVMVNNFTVKDTYGFGIHFRDCKRYRAEKLGYFNLTHPESIGVTITEGSDGFINDVNINKVGWCGIEINATKQLTISNAVIDSCGRPAIVFGDNDTKLTSDAVTLENIRVENSLNSNSLSVNYAKNITLKNCQFDKHLTTLARFPSENIRFQNCDFKIDASNLYFFYTRFKYINVTWNNVKAIRHSETENVYTSASIISIPQDGVYAVPINLFESEKGPMSAQLFTLSFFTTAYNQVSSQQRPFILGGNTIVLGVETALDGTSARRVVYSLDNKNRKVLLTNSSKVPLKISWEIK